MGGMWTLKAATTGRFDRAVPFYGMIRNPENWRSADNRDAIDAAGATPGRGRTGAGDHRHRRPVHARRQVDELEAAGATVVRYDGAEHGFVHDPDRPAHRDDDADGRRGRRAIAWLSAALISICWRLVIR